MGEVSVEAKVGGLTAAKVKTAKPRKYHDGGGTGLFLRVDLNGGRIWIQRIVIQGKRREIGLGAFPVVGLAEARKTALANKQLAYSGGDPLAERRKARETLTFADAVHRYLSAKLDEFRNEKHRKQWLATLDTYARPVLGDMPVRSISVADVLRAVQPIWSDKTETASRLRGRIENVLSWATVAGHREGPNPARWKGNLFELLPKAAKVAKSDNQPALALGDVVGWWTDLAQREGVAARALKFITLTAAPFGEVRGMKWEEIDFGPQDKTDTTDKSPRAVWTILASRMKNGREHRVPLTKEALALRQALPRMEDSPFVLFAPRGGMMSDMSISAAMRRMQEAEVKAGRVGWLDPKNKRPAVPHGLRSTFRQWAAEGGYPRDMAEMALAHFIGSEVERAYQRSDMLERRRAMMADWAGFLRGEIQGGNVVKLGAVL
jgi:integrase